jgi:hypothetical protein
MSTMTKKRSDVSPASEALGVAEQALAGRKALAQRLEEILVNDDVDDQIHEPPPAAYEIISAFGLDRDAVAAERSRCARIRRWTAGPHTNAELEAAEQAATDARKLLHARARENEEQMAALREELGALQRWRVDAERAVVGVENARKALRGCVPAHVQRRRDAEFTRVKESAVGRRVPQLQQRQRQIEGVLKLDESNPEHFRNIMLYLKNRPFNDPMRLPHDRETFTIAKWLQHQADLREEQHTVECELEEAQAELQHKLAEVERQLDVYLQ